MAVQRDRLTWMVYSQIAIYGLSLYSFAPAVTLLGDDEHVSKAIAALHGTGLAVGTVVAGLLAPRLIRRLGRVRMMWAALHDVVGRRRRHDQLQCRADHDCRCGDVGHRRHPRRQLGSRLADRTSPRRTRPRGGHRIDRRRCVRRHLRAAVRRRRDRDRARLADGDARHRRTDDRGGDSSSADRYRAINRALMQRPCSMCRAGCRSNIGARVWCSS